jgi:membrane protein YdbS with pleckstrin-like domain
MEAAMPDDAAQEKIVWTGRPSFWNWWWELAIADLLILLAALLWWSGGARWAPVALGCAAVVYAGVACKRLRHRFTATTQRVAVREGLLSRRVAEVEMREIRDIVLSQGILQRLAGIGDVVVSRTGPEASDMILWGLRRPERVKEELRKLRLAAKGA